MADSIVETELRVILTLSRKEALYLKYATQNETVTEDTEEKVIRESIFNALPIFDNLR